MPTFKRRLCAILLYLVPLVACWMIATRTSSGEGCLTDGDCSEREALALALYGAALMVGTVWILVAGLRGRLMGARAKSTAPAPRSGSWWFRVKATIGAATALAVFLALLNLSTLIAPLLTIAASYIARAGESSVIMRLLWPPFALMAPAAAFFWGGVPGSRILLRLLPPRSGVGWRPGAFVLAAVVALYTMLSGSAGALGLAAAEASSGIGLQPSISAVYFAISVALGLGLLGPFLARHLRPNGFVEAPFILVLRRFSSYADRAVLREVLGAHPTERQVVLLTPTRSQGGDWDPAHIGFAGLRWGAPFRSVPVYLRTTDDNWQAFARQYIASAQRIVFDASEESEAIRVESALIGELGRWADTLVLTTAAWQDLWPPGSSVVVYTRSWLRALPRMFVGVPATLLLGMGVARISLGLIRAAPALALLMAPLIGVVYLFFFLTFLQPAVDSSSARAIRRWAREGAIRVRESAGVRSRRGVLVVSGVLLLAIGARISGTLMTDAFATAVLALSGVGAVAGLLRDRLPWISLAAKSSLLLLLVNTPPALIVSYGSVSGALFGSREIVFLVPPAGWSLALLGSVLLFLAYREGEVRDRVVVHNAEFTVPIG